MSADADDARDAGRALAADAGPITDPGVIARVATVVHAATCMSNATNGRATDNAPAVHDKQEIAAPDVYE